MAPQLRPPPGVTRRRGGRPSAPARRPCAVGSGSVHRLRVVLCTCSPVIPEARRSVSTAATSARRARTGPTRPARAAAVSRRAFTVTITVATGQRQCRGRCWSDRAPSRPVPPCPGRSIAAIRLGREYGTCRTTAALRNTDRVQGTQGRRSCNQTRDVYGADGCPPWAPVAGSTTSTPSSPRSRLVCLGSSRSPSHRRAVPEGSGPVPSADRPCC